MLKGNLSTKPFYNDRLVSAAIAVLAALVLVASVVNVTRLVTLNSQRAEIRARLDADAAEAARIRAEAETLQARVDRVTLTRLANSAREANQLIDRRTFSWITLFGQLEDTLPAGVRLTAISPTVDRAVFRVGLAVVARSLDDIDTFVEALLDTGSFYDVAPVEQRANDDGSYQAVVQASYLPARATAGAVPGSPGGQP
jgi:Tfp pilus assembly protein PilN